MDNSVSSILTPAATVRRDANLGRILLEQGKITLEQLASIRNLQKEEGIPFGEAAMRLGVISETDIQMALSRQFDYPYLLAEQGTYPPTLKAAYQPFSAEVEALRSIRSQLMRRWFGEGNKTLALVSVNQGDGTSLLVANLAVVFAQLGKQTLIVDANLRTPSQHSLFNLPSGDGLADVLSGNAGLHLLSPMEAFIDLSLLPAGSMMPNVDELMSGTALGLVNEALCDRFDIILYDTPAFATAADALNIAAHAGGALVVVRKNYTGITELTAFSEQLRHSGTEIVGSVIVTF
ncbi:chain length determinant protein tyrosine kinase EpsG [Glaciimonas sp. Gout2]|uniref:chain length determinant protein tyrosine kinase EpsG n=1 Tax=unclassified Glaciimonas TaxID=2644401 RepID=UPI002B23E27A|nr:MULTISPECIES: chain length determinant protein tyrosine kinase EpsG [unclassified Glaciimonas]MEB0013662.1 chain length determinant protein tyrosine kinase EpsG [Glaciimonas sp. Cout2]MEB0083688.1 chain length determinant protein tyrosine kinase EpsG [Glaciimonas sp. Gout2]